MGLCLYVCFDINSQNNARLEYVDKLRTEELIVNPSLTIVDIFNKMYEVNLNTSHKNEASSCDDKIFTSTMMEG